MTVRAGTLRSSWVAMAVSVSLAVAIATADSAAAQTPATTPSTTTPEAAAPVEVAPVTEAETAEVSELVVVAPPAVVTAPPLAPAAPEREGLSPLRRAIDEAKTLASALVVRVRELRAKGTLTATEAQGYEAQLGSLTTLAASFDDRARALEALTVPTDANAKAALEGEQAALEKQAYLAKDTLAAVGAQLEAEDKVNGWTLIDKLLSARCSTAICFDNGKSKHWLGIEPLVELPIGIGFATGNSSLSDYVNNHDLRVDLAAGARVWLFRDVISISIYLSKPLIDSSVRLAGSSFVYPGSSIRRPYPGFAVGLLFDSIWIGFDRNELRNGDGQDASALNPDFPPNTVVSAAWTITLALQPVTAFRTAIGTAVQANEAGAR